MAFTHFYLTTNLALSLAVIASASVGGYVPNLNLDNPKLEKDKLLSSLIGVQGLIYCKSGPKLIPLEGAIARITCLGIDEYGYETAPWSFLSGATDAKGYFLATLSPSEIEDRMRIKECKAFLETSPFLKTCNLPTDVNNGITGAILASYNFLIDKKMKLFTVGPFFYTTNPKSVSNGYS